MTQLKAEVLESTLSLLPARIMAIIFLRWIFPPFHGRAGAAAYPALDTFVYLLAAGLGGYLINECLGFSYRYRFHNFPFPNLDIRSYTRIPSICAMISCEV